MSGNGILADITEETLTALTEEVRKSITTAGYTVGLGMQAYELAAPAKSLFPVLSPWRNRLPRVQAGVGSAAAHWKAITAINVGNASPFTNWGAAGNLVQTTEQDYLANYRPISLGDTVEWDAQVLARGFDDLRARAGTNLLYALMIAEDKVLLGSQNFALQTPGTPTVTTSTTGGSIATTTAINVKVSVRTIENYNFGGGTVYSAQGTVTTGAGSTNSGQASVTAVQGAVAYDWQVGGFYYTTTTVNTVTITTIPVANAALAALPNLGLDAGGVVPTAASRTLDTSADTLAFNGLLATLAGDYSGTGSQVTHGGGTASGAVFTSLNGAQLTALSGGVVEIDNALQTLWNVSRISPTALLCSSQQHRDITRKVIAGGGAYTLFQPDNVEQRRAVVGGAYLTQYLNPAVNGQPIALVTMPNLPDGTIIGVSETLPYPDTSVANVFEVETQQEYQQVEYAMSRGTPGVEGGGPRYDFEVRAIEVFKNFFPAGCLVISNILAG